jgi:hypothetical protein
MFNALIEKQPVERATRTLIGSQNSTMHGVTRIANKGVEEFKELQECEE